MQLAEVFRARVVDVAPGSLVIEMAGTEDKIDGLLDMLRPYAVIEMVRTGRVAMARGVGSRAGRTAPIQPMRSPSDGLFVSVSSFAVECR